MPVAFNKFYDAAEQIGLGTHDLNAHQIMAMLTNTAPVVTNALYSDVSGNELANGNGYTTGGIDIINVYTETGGVGSLTGTDPVWTSTGGMGPFRYAILYNNTATNKNLLGWYDYAASITPANTETFTLKFAATIFTVV